MALVLSCALVACDKKGTGDKTNSNDLGVYYEVVGSSLDEKSYIELKSGNVWYDGEDQGTFKITDGNITLYDGDTELMSGTISNGVLTLSFMGETTVYKKSGSMGSGNVDQKAMIKSIQNGKVDGLTVSLEIDNTIEDVDLSGMITTSKDCSWQLYTSRTATSADAIVTKIIVPKNGNNTYYIVVTSADGKTNRTYTLNVWKNYYATLSFYANGTFYTSEQVLTHTTYGSGPSCSVVGYTFNGWGCDGYYVTESKSFNANLTPLTYTAKFDSNGGSTISDKTATYDKNLSLPSLYKAGYTFLGWYYNGNLYKDSIKYTFTNDVTFTARWQLNYYKVIIKSENEICGTVNAYNGSKNYGNPVSLTATTNPGYIFIGWFANGTKISSELSINVKVPDYDVTYTAKWNAVDENIRNYKLRQAANGYIISAVIDKTVSKVIIPDIIVGIDDGAFSACTKIKTIIGNAKNVSTVAKQAKPSSFSVNITSGTSIGVYAFERCTGLTSITITDSVTSIGHGAFQNCTGLMNITIPDSVTSIGEGAFSGCTGLTSVTIGNSVTSIGDYAFSGCKGLTSVTIGNSVTSIGDAAFMDCSGLTSVTIPDSVTSIGSAFQRCTGLSSVTIGNGVTSIGKYAFFRCSGLTSITIPNSVTSIGYDAFAYCDNIMNIYYTGDVAGWCGISGLDNLMSKSRTLYIGGKKVSGQLIIPASVTKISAFAFYYCSGLTSVTIPDSMTSIGRSAFAYCTELTSIYYTGDVAGWCGISGLDNLMSSSRTLYIKGIKVEGDLVIPDSVTSINAYAFYDRIGLTSVIIGNGVTSIGKYAFYGCSGLTNITIPDSVTSIGAAAFEGCSGLTSVTIGKGVTSIGSSAFSGCYKLTSVTIGNGVTSIGDAAFRGCAGLTSIPIPDSVTSIGSWAFEGCSGLTSVTIPDSVTSIGVGSFKGCNNLTSMTVPFIGSSKTASNEYDQVFGYIFGYTTSDSSSSISGATYQYYGNSKYFHYYIPSSMRSVTITGGKIPSDAFNNCSRLTSITIGNSVTSIGSWAFKSCTGLTSVKIGNGVTSIGYNAFLFCAGLTSITIPDSVTSIGEGAFRGCNNLTSMTLPFVGARATANGYDQVFGYIFGYEKNDSSSSVLGATYQYMEYSNGYKYYHYYIPSSIESVTITGGNIPDYAFNNCSGLTSVTIGNGVTSIGENAFYNCRSLTSITIPDSVTSIGSYAFESCNNLQDIYITDIATWCNISGLYSLMKYGASNKKLYINNELVTSIILPNGVTEIPSYAFRYCSGLKSVTIGNSVTSIGDCAFSGCSELTSITIPDSVTSIGSYAFSGCSGLTSVIIPNSVTSIGKEAFYGCYKLIEVYNKSTLSITAGSSSNGYVAYYAKNVYKNEGGSKLTTDENGYVIYTDGDEKILVAYHGTNTELTLPSGITQVHNYAFYKCSGLTSITIPNSVTIIGQNAFNGCTGLTSVTIPDSVTSIGKSAFEDCTGLTSISGSATNASTVAKQARPTSFTVNITSGTSIGDEAFRNCTGLTSITIHDSVTSIGYGAFYGCSKLTSVTFNGTISQWNAISKGINWKYNVPSACKVICTDGTVSI